MKHWPSKKFTIILISIFAGLILIFAGSYFLSSKKTVENIENIKQNGLTVGGGRETIQNLIEKDSDGDGLLDWEEALWGTNPNLADSDGNGISDKEEIEQKKQSLQGGELTQVENKNLSQTDRFAQEFLATFMALKQSGNLSPEALSNLSTSFTESITEETVKINFYSLNDLESINDSEENTTQYIIQIKNLAGSYEDQKLGQEMEVLAKMIEEETGGEGLISIGEAYRDFANKAKSVPVPEKLAQNHLRLINSSLGTGQALINLSTILNDPLRGITFLNNYVIYSDELTEAIKTIEEIETVDIFF